MDSNSWVYWENHWLDHCSDTMLKQQVLQAMAILKKYFSYPFDCKFISNYFSNLAAWSGWNIVHMARVISFFEDHGSFKLIIASLKCASSAQSRFSELEFKYLLHSKFQCKFDVTRHNVEVDCIVKFDAREIPIEITQLNLSKKHAHRLGLFSDLNWFLMKENFKTRVKVISFGSLQTIQPLIEQISLNKELYTALSPLCHLQINGAQIEIVNKPLNAQLEGPPIVDDSQQQIKRKLYRKYRQTIRESPNILVIYADIFWKNFSIPAKEVFVREWEAFISSEHKRYSAIVFVGASGLTVDSHKIVKVASSFSVIAPRLNGTICYSMEIIMNTMANFSLTGTEVSKILSLFEDTE